MTCPHGFVTESIDQYMPTLRFNISASIRQGRERLIRTHSFQPIAQILLATGTHARDRPVCGLLFRKVHVDQRLERVAMLVCLVGTGTHGRKFDGLVSGDFVVIRRRR